MLFLAMGIVNAYNKYLQNIISFRTYHKPEGQKLSDQQTVLLLIRRASQDLYCDMGNSEWGAAP
jgi:hypothetical protein